MTNFDWLHCSSYKELPWFIHLHNLEIIQLNFIKRNKINDDP